MKDNRRQSFGITGSLIMALGFAVLHAVSCSADSVDITLPASISFSVTDITTTTTGSPSPTTISYTSYVPGSGTTLHISIQANDSGFARPTESGGVIPASAIQWTAGVPASGGTTFPGSLDSLSYTEIYRGTPASNSFDITWTLAPLDPSVRAGIHSISATWKVESL